MVKRDLGGVDTKPLYKKKWFIVVVVILVLALIGAAMGDEDEKAAPSGVASDTEQAAENMEVSFPQDNAKWAAVAALTNCFADDVYTEDGNALDESKLHSYADLSGYYLTVDEWGDWSEGDADTWHVEGLELHPYASPKATIDATLDVSFDGNNYQVSNVSGEYGNNGSSNTLALTELTAGLHEACLTVPAALASEDRDAEQEAANDHTGDLDEDSAMTALQNYGDRQYPYGFKIHWISGRLANEQSVADGSWYFKVNVTVTNAYGADADGVCEAKVTGTSSSPVVQEFSVYKS